MTELTRKIEPADVINSLASISIPFDRIHHRGKLDPNELLRIQEVGETHLVLRAVIDVQKYGREGIVPEVADQMFEVATKMIHEARLIILSMSAAGSVDRLLELYAETAEATLYLLGLVDPNLEERYKLVLRWMTH